MADAAAHFETVEIGKHDVEDDGVIGILDGHPHGIRARADDVYRIALLLEPTLEKGCHLHGVLDDEYPRHDHLPANRRRRWMRGG